MGLTQIAKFFWKKLLLDILLIAVILFMPNLPPNADIAQTIKLSKTKPLEGPLALNVKLRDVKIWHKGEVFGPEAFAEYNGELYATVLNGEVVKLVGDKIITVAKTGRPCQGHHEEHICGRPLGLEFDKSGYLIVADAYYGILKINVNTGEKEVIVPPNLSINGKKPKLFNNVALASNGDIYWSDSSTQFQLRDLAFESLADPSGRLIHYDAKTKTNKVLIDKLHFANGVVLSDDEEFVLVAETFHNKVHRYYLKGPKKGTSDVFIDGLPGLPDNIGKDGHGGFFFPLVESHDEDHPLIYQAFYPFPLIRKFFCRLMGLTESVFESIDRHYPNEFSQKVVYHIGSYQSAPKFLSNSRSTIVHVSKNGNIIDSVHSIKNGVSHIAEVFIFKDEVFLGSPLNDYIGRIPLSSLGWEKPIVKREVPIAEPKVQTKEVPKVETRTPPPVKQQPTTTTTPKPETTTTPKPQTTQAPKAQTTTSPPPTQAPKTQPPTPKPTQAPKTQPTQAPTRQPSKPQPTQAPKAQPTPKQETKSQPKQESAPPKRDAPKQQTTARPTTTPPAQKTAPPTKPQTAPPKQQTPPPKQTGGKAVPAKEL